MRVVITGGAGFLGARLIESLLAEGSVVQPDEILAIDRVPCPIDDRRVRACVGTITDRAWLASLVTSDVTHVWHLAAVLSGQSEAEPDLAMAVNVDATSSLLTCCRSLS